MGTNLSCVLNVPGSRCCITVLNVRARFSFFGEYNEWQFACFHSAFEDSQGWLGCSAVLKAVGVTTFWKGLSIQQMLIGFLTSKAFGVGVT